MKKHLAGLAVAGFASLFVRAAHADDTSLEGLLAEEVVTSVSKTAETSHDAPALTRSISAEDIRRYGMTSIANALDFLGVGVHTEAALGKSELTIRGIGFTGDRGNHVLVLVDGQIVNEPLFGDAPLDERLGLALELVDHIELVLGPGSAMYGTNAVLAVVNIVTKSAKTLEGFHATAEVGAVGTQRATVTMGKTFDLFGKRAGIAAGLSYFRQDSSIELKRQDLGVDASGRPESWGGVADDSYRSDIPGLQLRFVREGLEIYGRATAAKVGDPTGIGDFDHAGSGTSERAGRLAIKQRFTLGRVGELSASVFAQGYANDRHTVISRRSACPFPGVATCDYSEREQSNRVGGEVQTTLDWLQNGRVVTALGATASLDHVAATNVPANYDNGLLIHPATHTMDIDSVFNAAANGQQSFKPFSWLDLVAGARVDWRKINESDGEHHTFTPVITPRLAAATRPWSGATLKAIYAEAFRAPNPYELDAQQQILIKSVALVPETTRSVEGIFEQRIGAQRVMFGAFRTEYHGIINRLLLGASEAEAAYRAGLTTIPPSSNAPLYQYQSDDYLETRGFNLGLDGTLLDQRLRYGASFTGSVARADRVERVLVAPQVFGNARVSYDFGGKLPTAALAATFAGDAATDRGYDAGFKNVTYAPPSLQLRATLTGAVPWVKGLSYRVIVAHQRNEATPFAVGPNLRARTGFETVPLTPTQPWNAIVGFSYDLGD